MKSSPYYFEIKDVMTQFVAAFNDIIINRYNKSRDKKSRVKVRYMYSPKQRVVHDLTNKARHITLPVVAVNITGMSRDEGRVFNKIEGSYLSSEERHQSASKTELSQSTYHTPQPVPINIQVSMSILARYQSDIEQIVSNFVPYCDPYIVISWKMPNEFTPLKDQEIRSEVDWSGDLSINYPEQLTGSEPYRVSADTSFTIRTWLFKKAPTPVGNIFHITTNITPVSSIDSSFSFSLPYYDDVTEKSYIQGLGPPLTAAPFLTHVDTSGQYNELIGYNFNSVLNVYLSSSEINELSGQGVVPFNSPGLEYMSTLHPPFTAVPVNFEIINDNKIYFNIPTDIELNDEVDIVIRNIGGYETALNSTLHGKGIFIQ